MTQSTSKTTSYYVSDATASLCVHDDVQSQASLPLGNLRYFLRLMRGRQRKQPVAPSSRTPVLGQLHKNIT